MVEWAEFSPDTDLPFDRLIVSINYLDDTVREMTFKAVGEKSLKLLEKMVQENENINI